MTTHAIQRALERYGLTLMPAELAIIRDRARTDGVLMRRWPNSGDIYAVEYRERVMICAIKGDAITTFLPPEAVYGGRKAKRLKREART